VERTLSAFKIDPQKSYNHQGAVLFVCDDILGSVAHGSTAAKAQPAVLPNLDGLKKMLLEGC
jgi:hypothetical protein